MELENNIYETWLLENYFSEGRFMWPGHMRPDSVKATPLKIREIR